MPFSVSVPMLGDYRARLAAIPGRVFDGAVEVGVDGGIEMVADARDRLNQMVYFAPLPPSAYSGWRTIRNRRTGDWIHVFFPALQGSASSVIEYLRRARTGRTKTATQIVGTVVAEPGFSVSAAVNTDIANRNGFPYPVVLERGSRRIRYYPRPFWSTAFAAVKPTYFAKQLAMFKETVHW